MIARLYFIPSLKMNWLIIAENSDHAEQIMREQAPGFEAILIKDLYPGEGVIYQVFQKFE